MSDVLDLTIFYGCLNLYLIFILVLNLQILIIELEFVLCYYFILLSFKIIILIEKYF